MQAWRLLRARGVGPCARRGCPAHGPADRPADSASDQPDKSFHGANFRPWAEPDPEGDCNSGEGVLIFVPTNDIAFGPRGSRADRVMNLPRTFVPAGANALDRALCFYGR